MGLERLEDRLLLDNAPPTDVTIYPNSVEENAPVGSLVGVFSTVDPDDQSFTYKLIDAADNDNRFFSIQDGKLWTAAQFDYEARGRSPAYDIVVRVTDEHEGSLVKRIAIFVIDVNEPPQSLALSPNRIDENRPAGTTVGRLSATDPEGDTPLSYELLYSAGGPDTEAFSLSGADLKTKVAFDYETQREYQVQVRVTDSRGEASFQTVSVFVNNVNERPVAVDQLFATQQNVGLFVSAPGLLQGAVDPEGAGMVVRLHTNPEHGVVTVRPDGSFEYQPDQDFGGADKFTYQVFDGRSYSDPATATIRVDYGPNPVVRAPNDVVGPNRLFLGLFENNVRLVNFTNWRVLLDKPVSELTSITLRGVDNRPDNLTIDASLSVPGVLPGGVSFDGGSGHLPDALTLRGSPAADAWNVGAGGVLFNGLHVALSNIEQLVLEGGAGDDVYRMASLPVATVLSDRAGTDRLDFSGAAAAVRIDLGKSSPQQAFATGGSLTLQGTIEHLVGTAFSDWIKGNAANNLLIGGDGDDRLEGGPGRDILIGGNGADTLLGGAGEDILIGGTTAYDADAAALAAIMKEWSSNRSFQKRRANLATGLFRLEKGATVLDDAARDELFGNAGQDWFFDVFPDVVRDRARNER